MNCPNCNANVQPGELFCPDCGTPIPQDANPRCQFCNTEIKEGQRFCVGCGRPASEALANKVVCRQCGASMEEGALFCPQCGAAQTESQPSPLSSGATISSTPRTREKRVSVVVGDDVEDFDRRDIGKSPEPALRKEDSFRTITPVVPKESSSSFKEQKEQATPASFNFREPLAEPAAAVLAPPDKPVPEAMLASAASVEETPAEGKSPREIELEQELERERARRQAGVTNGHTPETEKEMEKLDQLIAQLEEKETTLPVGQKPVQTRVEQRTEKKEEKKKRKANSPEPSSEEEKTGESGLRTVLFILLVILLAAGIAIGSMFYFRKRNATLQEQAMSSTVALQEEIVEKYQQGEEN